MYLENVMLLVPVQTASTVLKNSITQAKN